MLATISGIFLGINKGVFQDKPFITALILTRDSNNILKTEKVSVKNHKEEIETLTFGDKVDLSVEIRNSKDYGTKITY